MYQELLKKLGFDDKEIAVFIAVLERGKVTPATVATITGINRSTVYSIAKVLADKGILRIDTTSEPSYLIIESADVLENIVKREERELSEKKTVVADAMKLLDSLPKSKHYSVPKIRFINEAHLEDFFFKQLPIWVESAKSVGELNWWGFQDPSFLDEYPKWIEHHWKIFPENMGTRLITNKKPSEEELSKKHSSDRRQIKYWDKSKEFTATHTVIGDYVLFVVTSQHPHYLVETHDAVMAKNLREMFKGLWEKI